MPQGRARGQNLGHLKKSFFFFAFIFLLCNQSYFKNRYYSGLTFFLVTSDSMFFLLFYLLRNYSLLNNGHYLGST